MSWFVDWLGGLLGAAGLSTADKIQFWISLFSAVTAFATLGLFLFAFFQVRAIRWSEKKWHTNSVCSTYDTDPVLNEATRRIFALSKGKDYSFATLQPEMHSILTLLNYFAGVAIGVSQGIYDETIVRDSLKENIERAVDRFITQEYASYIDENNLVDLVNLRRKWRPQASKIRP